MKIHLIHQYGINDCGPASLMMILHFYNMQASYKKICIACDLSSRGISLYNLNQCAKNLGFNTAVLKCNASDIIEYIPLPSILYWEEKHFSVLYQADENGFLIADPILGFLPYSKDEFSTKWYMKEKEYGILIAIEPVI